MVGVSTMKGPCIYDTDRYIGQNYNRVYSVYIHKFKKKNLEWEVKQTKAMFYNVTPCVFHSLYMYTGRVNLEDSFGETI